MKTSTKVDRWIRGPYDLAGGLFLWCKFIYRMKDLPYCVIINNSHSS